MKCKLCDQNLVIADNEESSPIGTTEIITRLTLVCTNPNCANYCGPDLNADNLKVAETVEHRRGGSN